MDIQSILMWTYSNAAAGKARTQRDAFADPLDHPEWRDMGWAVSLISWLVSPRRRASPPERKTQAVERFTVPVSERGVCVS